jgi:hypothetical protein
VFSALLSRGQGGERGGGGGGGVNAIIECMHGHDMMPGDCISASWAARAAATLSSSTSPCCIPYDNLCPRGGSSSCDRGGCRNSKKKGFKKKRTGKRLGAPVFRGC